MIDSAEACRRLGAVRHQIQSEAEIAEKEGLSPVSFAIYELLEVRPVQSVPEPAVSEQNTLYRTEFDEETKSIARSVEAKIDLHNVVVDWQSNLEVRREMRRDVKRELRSRCDYGEDRLDRLANQIVDLAVRRSLAVTERDSVRFGDTTIEFEVRRSERRKKTVQLTVDGGGVQVAAPAATPDSELRAIVRKRAAWILGHSSSTMLGGGAEALRERRDAAVPGPERANDHRRGGHAMAGGAIRSLALSNRGATEAGGR